MRDKFKCLRRYRRKLVKAVCVLIVVIIVIFTLESSTKGASIEKAEADAELVAFVGSRETPSGVSVLPDQETVVHNVQSHCNLGNGSQVLTLFVVISSPANRATRDIIRSGFKFYLRDYNGEIGGTLDPRRKLNTLLFFTGLPATVLEKQKLLNEASLYNDLIVDNLKDSYYNLTLKSLRMLKWVEQNCYNADFTVKVDDDFHINLRRFLSVLESLSREDAGKNLVGGTVFKDALPIRDPSSIHGKWYTPYELWSRDTFPDYVGGYFYVLGKEARTKIYHAALLKPLFHLEDVFITGIIAKETLGLRLTDLPVISHWWTPLRNLITSSCDIQNHYMGIHFHTKVFNYLDCWKGFNDKEFLCSA